MAYTVKKLAELSGVSIRTLRWYDEIGLLKPAYYGSNGYRYYEEEQLLMLQQILFFRELGFKLNDIQRILKSSDFDKIKALYSHKRILKESLVRTKELIKTVEKTILHLRGKQIMEDKEMYKGFYDWAEGKGSESYFLGSCDNLYSAAETLVLKSVKKQNNKDLDKSHWENITRTAHDIYREIVECIDTGLEPTTDAVQSIIEKHHAFSERFHTSTKEVYKALAELYREHPAYKKQLDPFHLQLAAFMASAMEVFADSKLA